MKKLCVYDFYVIKIEDLITYESPMQEIAREYSDLVD